MDPLGFVVSVIHHQCLTLLSSPSSSGTTFAAPMWHDQVKDLKVDPNNHHQTIRNFDAVAANTNAALDGARTHLYHHFNNLDKNLQSVHDWHAAATTPSWKEVFEQPSPEQNFLYSDHLKRGRQIEKYRKHFIRHGDTTRAYQADGHIKINDLIMEYSRTFPMDHIDYNGRELSYEKLNDLDQQVSQVKYEHGV
jgi:hypothetical protein